MADERPVNDMGTILRKVRTMQKSNTARAQGHYDRLPRASVRGFAALSLAMVVRTRQRKGT